MNIEGKYKTLDGVQKDLNKIDEKFDLVFLDPWHTYEDSLAALEVAYNNKKPDGIMVVHDCLPRNTSMSPKYVPGGWSGLTALDFRDFVENLSCNWLVIDSDYGIGVIGKKISSAPRYISNVKWNDLKFDEKIQMFAENARAVMHAISDIDSMEGISRIKDNLDVSNLSESYSGHNRNFYILGEFEKLTQERDQLTQERDQLTQERDQLKERLFAALNSSTWKLLKWYRKIKKSLLGR